MDQNNIQPECYADWLNLQLHLLWCYDHTVAAEPNRATKPIYWGCNSAWLVRSGFAQVERNGIAYRANAGEWLIVPKGTFPATLLNPRISCRSDTTRNGRMDSFCLMTGCHL